MTARGVCGVGVGAMSDGAIWVAKCWECGWVSPSCETESSAHYWVGWHAIEYGCPVNTVRPLRTSEVSSR